MLYQQPNYQNNFPSLEMHVSNPSSVPIYQHPQYSCGVGNTQHLGYVNSINPIQRLQCHPIAKSFRQIIGDLKVSTMIDFTSFLSAFTIIITWLSVWTRVQLIDIFLGKSLNQFFNQVHIFVTTKYYLVAGSLGHVEWFPCMITSTGKNYPENIFFRIGMIGSIFYWVLQMRVVFFFLKAHSESLAEAVHISPILNGIAYFGFFFYGLTIATIDQGFTPTHFHGICAVLFFILLCTYSVMSFQIIRKIRELKPDFISESSFNRKKFLVKGWWLVLFFVILLASGQKWALSVAEWIGTFSIILYLQTFATDLKNFFLNVDDLKYDLKLQLSRNLAEKQGFPVPIEYQNNTAFNSLPFIMHNVPPHQIAQTNQTYVYPAIQNLHHQSSPLVDSSFMAVKQPQIFLQNQY